MPRLLRMLKLQARFAGADVVVSVAAIWLTDENAGDLDEQVAALLGRRVPPRLRLDLARVEMVTSVPLGQLMALNKRVRAAGGHMVVENVSPPVAEIFRITRIDQILDVRLGAT